jgi:hypothetical protein
MHIYKAEKDAGLTELLSAKSSIVYASLAEKGDKPQIAKASIDNKSFAGIEDSDLYYTQSILVTTSWNKNDDIFDPREVWAAKSTPTHKPTNLEHDENSIVGHITSNWPIDEDGQIIEENTDPESLPEKFHILTGSVIYTGYTEPELKDRALSLIKEIESGTKYVSMECFFKGFDYGLVNKTTGKYNILPRNEETAFLTQHLRAYGGLGEHQNYKIGRVLKEITFSGKGFVNKPANPESIIFTKEELQLNKEIAEYNIILEKNNDFSEEGVFSNQANLKETNMSVETENTTVVAETETVEVPTVVEATVETDQQVEAAKKMKEEMMKKEEEMKKMKAALETAQNELSSANEVLAAYKSKEEEMMKKEKKMKRMASLVESGIDQTTAENSVEKLDGIDDELFSVIASLIASKQSVKASEDEEDDEEDDSEEMKSAPKASVVDASVLETAEVEEAVSLSVGSDEDSQVQNTRAALVDFVCTRLGKKLNKGE